MRGTSKGPIFSMRTFGFHRRRPAKHGSACGAHLFVPFHVEALRDAPWHEHTGGALVEQALELASTHRGHAHPAHAHGSQAGGEATAETSPGAV